MLLKTILCVLLATATAQDCSTALNYPTTPDLLLWRLSGAFLQIHRTVPVTCTGLTLSWLFRSQETTNSFLPIFSVWEEHLDAKNELNFRLIGFSQIKPQFIEPAGNDWYRYFVPREEQFMVDSSKKQFVGIFYEKADTVDHVSVSYLSPPKTWKEGRYDNWKNSSVVAAMAWPSIQGNITNNSGSLKFNTSYMDFDYRLPFLQLTIGTPTAPPVQPTPSPVQPPPTPPSPPTGRICRNPPSIENGSPIQAAAGFLGEQVTYECEAGYSVRGDNSLVCDQTGVWRGQLSCVRVSTTCYVPLQVGTCKKVIPMWYFHLDAKECRPFWYSGCEGNANKFHTEEECKQLCGFLIKTQ